MALIPPRQVDQTNVALNRTLSERHLLLLREAHNKRVSEERVVAGSEMRGPAALPLLREEEDKEQTTPTRPSHDVFLCFSHT
jgi:hypothetical protein